MIEWFKKGFNDLTIDELYDILRLRSEIFVVEQDCVYQDLDMKDKECIHLFGVEDGEVVATLRIIPAGLSYDVPAIGRVSVKENYRRKGYARKMMLDAIEVVRSEYKAEKIRLSGQAYLKDFYLDLGFRMVTELYHEDGIPHFGFELDMKL